MSIRTAPQKDTSPKDVYPNILQLIFTVRKILGFKENVLMQISQTIIFPKILFILI